MHYLFNFLIYIVLFGVTALILPGVKINSLWTLIVSVIILGLVNLLIKPILLLLTLPLSIITLGLFCFVLNALMVLLAAEFVEGFEVKNFWWALLFSLIVSGLSSMFIS